MKEDRDVPTGLLWLVAEVAFLVLLLVWVSHHAKL